MRLFFIVLFAVAGAHKTDGRKLTGHRAHQRKSSSNRQINQQRHAMNSMTFKSTGATRKQHRHHHHEQSISALDITK